MAQLQAFFGGPLGGALLALAGVIVGGLLEGRRQRQAFQRQREWERTKLRLQRLEEIGNLASEIYTAVSKALDKLSEICAQEDPRQLTADRLLLHSIEEQQRVATKVIQRLEALGEGYAPQLTDKIAALRQSWQVTYNTQTRLLAIGVDGPLDVWTWIELLSKSLESTKSGCERLRQAAGAIIQELMGISAAP